jgi:hypothetical protein
VRRVQKGGRRGPELTGRGDCSGFIFDPSGADVPLVIRLGQGVRGSGGGGGAARCGWKRNGAWRGNPRPAVTDTFSYRVAAIEWRGVLIWGRGT